MDRINQRLCHHNAKESIHTNLMATSLRLWGLKSSPASSKDHQKAFHISLRTRLTSENDTKAALADFLVDTEVAAHDRT